MDTPRPPLLDDTSRTHELSHVRASDSTRAASTHVRLSVVVLSWNTRELLRACLRALEADSEPGRRELIVVDNASGDGSADMVALEFPHVRLLRNTENLLYAEGNNQGARLATGEYLCLLNSDTAVRPGALEYLARFLDEHADYGAVAPRLVNADGSIQRACRRFPTLADALFDSTSLGRIPPATWFQRWTHMEHCDHAESRDVPQPPGACFMIRRAEYEALGGLDQDLRLYFNDVDLCRALWARGRRIRYLAEVEVLHHGGASTRAFHWKERNTHYVRDRARYYRKHYGRTGDWWLRAVTTLWSLECRMRIRLGPRDARAKRVALAELSTFLQKCDA